MKNVHIGNIIKQKFEESHLTMNDFASKINRTRSTVYDIFNRKSIDTDLLLKISEVLNYNFLSEVYIEKEVVSSEDSRYFLAVEIDCHDLSLEELENQLHLLRKIGRQK